MEFITYSDTPKKKEPTVLEKIKEAVKQTKENFTEQIQDLVEGKKEIDADMLEELEAIMIGADIGVATTNEILNAIHDQMSRKMLQDPKELRSAIKEELRKILNVNYTPPKQIAGRRSVRHPDGRRQWRRQNDDDRQARQSFQKRRQESHAVRRRHIPRRRHRTTRNLGDTRRMCRSSSRRPAPILRRCCSTRCSRRRRKKIDYVIVDTAGRLHTKHNLMAELEKMTRIAKREVPGAPHEVLLVMDATTGQNGLTQAREFTKSAGVTGLVLTKLDGTAKGGVVTAIAKELKIPIRFVGVGEKMDDLIEFSADDFVESLFAA